MLAGTPERWRGYLRERGEQVGAVLAGDPPPRRAGRRAAARRDAARAAAAGARACRTLQVGDEAERARLEALLRSARRAHRRRLRFRRLARQVTPDRSGVNRGSGAGLVPAATGFARLASKRACMKLHLRALLTGSLLAALAPFASAHAAAGPPGSLDAAPHAAAVLLADACAAVARALRASRARAPSRSAPTGSTSTSAAAPRSPRSSATPRPAQLTQARRRARVRLVLGRRLRPRARPERRLADRALARRPPSLCGLVDRELRHRLRA